MQIFGHDFIENERFASVSDINEIKKTLANSIILMSFNKEIITYAKEQNLSFGVHVETIKELVLASASQASYLLVDKNFAKEAQNIANEYMYDAKVLLISKDEDEIEFCAKNGIDGIVFLN